MTEKCYEQGTMQGFLDGELAPEIEEAMLHHLAECDDCAILLATAEEESALAYSVLEQEFNTLVPTQRLWAKINDSIEREKKSFWKPIFAFLLQPSTAAFASLLLVAVVSIALFTAKPDAPTEFAVRTSLQPSSAVQLPATAINAPVNQTANQPAIAPASKFVQSANYKSSSAAPREIKAVYAVPENNRASNVRTISNISNTTTGSAPRETLAGEASYLKTIAALTQTVNNRKDDVLDSSSRFSFERDLAVTNDAISKMRQQVKANPRDEAAKQILRSSYQNKIDLLNSVADKTELMASLR